MMGEAVSRPSSRPARPAFLAFLTMITLVAAAGAYFGVPVVGASLFGDPTLWNAGKPVKPVPSVLAAAGTQQPIPTSAGVGGAITSLLTGLGARQISVSVGDVVTGQELYASAGQTALIPASTTKLVTAV